MDDKAELRRALTSDRRFLPYWYQYDDKGSHAFIDSADYNEYYYLPKSEKQIIQENVKEIFSSIQKPFLLADLGCGNAEKCHYLFEEYLRDEESMTFAPVDICRDIVSKVKQTLDKQYGDKLDVVPISGEFTTSLPQLFSIPGKKLIVSFSAILNMSYQAQVKLLTSIADSMTENDKMVLTFDMTQDKDLIEKAYLDITGYFDKQMMRGVERLNDEQGANFDCTTFVIEGEYIPNDDVTIPGALHRWLRFLTNQTITVENLGIELKFDKDDRLYLAEYGDTHKYTDKQIYILVKRSNLEIVQMWKNQHCSLVLLQKQS